MNKIYSFLFPGQGSQFVGMGKNDINNHPLANKLYEEAFNILDYDIKQISFNGPEHLLNETLYTQPAIFINSIIKDKLLKLNNIIPSMVAGHSLGEYSALVSCDVLSYKDALTIIKVRAEEMNNAGVENPGAMFAVFGITKEQSKTICDQKGTLVAANFNSKEQIVFSGDVDSVKNAIKDCKKNGIKRIFPLKTSAAFHSPLMKSARKSLTKVIKSIEFKDAKMPIYQNCNPHPETEAINIKSNLLKQLEHPVYWYDTIINMSKDNKNKFIEVGPGQVLTKLNNRILSKNCSYTYNTVIHDDK